MQAPFQLTIEDVSGALRVHSLRGKEALSQGWRFEVIVSGGLSAEVERTGLGPIGTSSFIPATSCAPFMRVWSVRLEEVHSIDREIKYRIVVVPRLSLLKRRKEPESFRRSASPTSSQGTSEFGIIIRWTLLRSTLCVNIAPNTRKRTRVVRRILAEAGSFSISSAAAR